MDTEVPGLDDVLAEVGDVKAMNVVERKKILLKGLDYFHFALADYLLMNPGATLREIGAFFGYQPAWICTIVKSDMFQAYLATRRKNISMLVDGSLPMKLELAAHLATERMIEVLPQLQDSKQIIDAFDTVMHKAGYAPTAKTVPQGGPTNIQNNFYMNKADLAEVKGVLLDHHSPSPAASLADKTVEATPEPRLPAPA